MKLFPRKLANWMTLQGFMIKSVECSFMLYSFILSDKKEMSDKLYNEYKQLTTDLDKQNELIKKLKENITEQTKQYNELVKHINK